MYSFILKIDCRKVPDVLKTRVTAFGKTLYSQQRAEKLRKVVVFSARVLTQRNLHSQAETFV